MTDLLYNRNWLLDGFKTRLIEVTDGIGEVTVSGLNLEHELKDNETYVLSANIILLNSGREELESSKEFYATFTNTDPELRLHIYVDQDEVKFIELSKIKIESLKLTEWTPNPKDIFIVDNGRAVRSKYRIIVVTWKYEEREVIHPFSKQTLQDRLLLPEGSYIQTVGKNGKTVFSYERQYRDGKATDEIRDEVVKEHIEPIDEVAIQGTMLVEWRFTTYSEDVPFGRTVENNSNLLPENSYLKNIGVIGTNTYSIETKWVNNVNTGEIRNQKLIYSAPPKNEVWVQGTMQAEWRNESRVESVPYGTTEQTSNLYFEDERVVSVKGVLGKRTFTWQAEFINNVRTGNTRNHANSIKAGDEPKNEIVLVGTRKRNIIETEPFKPTYYWHFRWKEMPDPEKVYKLSIKALPGFSNPTGSVYQVTNAGRTTVNRMIATTSLPKLFTGEELTNGKDYIDRPTTSGLALNPSQITQPTGYYFVVEEQL